MTSKDPQTQRPGRKNPNQNEQESQEFSFPSINNMEIHVHCKKALPFSPLLTASTIEMSSGLLRSMTRWPPETQTAVCSADLKNAKTNASGQDVHGQVMEIHVHCKKALPFSPLLTASTIEMSSGLLRSMTRWPPETQTAVCSADLKNRRAKGSSTKLLRPTVERLSCEPTEPVR